MEENIFISFPNGVIRIKEGLKNSPFGNEKKLKLGFLFLKYRNIYIRLLINNNIIVIENNIIIKKNI